jgi:acetolactate synthase-1/2/3 large subunit
VSRYPSVLPEYWKVKDAVNPYCFMEALFEQLEPGDIVVTGDGTACVVSFQAAKLKRGQRLYTNSGCASMGYDLPAAIGAWYGSGAKRIICLAGDGSVMLNLQEVQSIVGNQLPIKLFILNNNGYHSIRQTQQNYFPDNIVGCGPDSRLTFPDFQKVLTAFGMESRRCRTHGELQSTIAATLSGKGPQACEVYLDKAQVFAPKLSSRKLEDGTMVSSPLEDMAPFLTREELAENMLIPPMK